MPVREGGEFVDQVSAIKAWAQAAHQVLVETAAATSTIDAQALARQVQKRSGVLTNQPASKWIGPLLGIIARQCNASGLPLLVSLVVRRDGTVGPGYDEVIRYAGMPGVVGDPDEHAQQQRELCYRQWRDVAPAPQPSAPARTTRVVGKPAAKKAAPAARATANKEPLRGNVCPTCFMQMSLTGVCDNCD